MTGWDGGASIGSQVDDASIEIALTDNVYSGDVTVPGKGNWQISDWAGGYVTITVNLNTNKVKFEATGSGPAVLPTGTMYVVGALSGWAEPSQDNAETYENYQLNEYDNNGIYTGTFNIAAGSFQFKIYKALTGWNGGDAIGAQEEDSNVDITLTDNVYTGPAVAGKGNWNYADWAGGTVKIEYNSNNSTVTFTAQ